MGKTKGNVNKLSLVVQAYNSSMQGALRQKDHEFKLSQAPYQDPILL